MKASIEAGITIKRITTNPINPKNVVMCLSSLGLDYLKVILVVQVLLTTLGVHA
jgi:hypothetical protein